MRQTLPWSLWRQQWRREMTTPTHTGLTFEGVQWGSLSTRHICWKYGTWETSAQEKIRRKRGSWQGGCLTEKRTFGQRSHGGLGKCLSGKGSSRARPEGECAWHVGRTKGHMAKRGLWLFSESEGMTLGSFEQNTWCALGLNRSLWSLCGDKTTGGRGGRWPPELPNGL